MDSWWFVCVCVCACVRVCVCVCSTELWKLCLIVVKTWMILSGSLRNSVYIRRLSTLRSVPQFISLSPFYRRRHLVSGEGIMSSVCVCVRWAMTACRFSLGGEGNALYPVFSSSLCLCLVSVYLLSGSIQILESHGVLNSNFPGLESHGIKPRSWKVMENKRNGCRISDPCTCFWPLHTLSLPDTLLQD